MPARTSPTLHPPSPLTVHQLSRLALSELKKSPVVYISDILFSVLKQFPALFPGQWVLPIESLQDDLYPNNSLFHIIPGKCTLLTLKVLVTAIDAQWEGWGM